MKITRFISSKSVTLCCVTIGLILWCVFAILAGTSALVVGVTGAAVFAITVGVFVLDYLLINKRLRHLDRLCNEIQEGYLLGEVFPKPFTAVEEEYYRIMKFVSRSAIEMTEQAKREKEEYSSYLEKWIHEIKTPLTACSLIAANDGDFRKLKTELKRAENLIENILYYARMRTVEADIQISNVSAHAVIDAAVKSEMELLLQADIGIKIDGDFRVYTDAKSLEFILKQFLVNSAKYCRGCQISVNANDGVITFEDNGAGIAPHELPRIFSRGFVGSAGRQRGGGTGMGLYIVHELCTKLDIDLKANSEEGKYTKFILTFPNSSNRDLPDVFN